MANGAIESRLISSLHRGSKKGELDLAAKLKIQQKQNSLPKVQFTQPTLEIATDIDKLKSKYIVLTPKECGSVFHPLRDFPAFLTHMRISIGHGGFSSGLNWSFQIRIIMTSPVM
jgi:hypothetical protein